MSSKFEFNRDDYSEQVIRKALYWLSETCEWSLGEEGSDWIVRVKGDVDNAEFELSRLLNDFKLREQLDIETKGMRKELIRSALHGIAASK
ncbi:MAG: His-Xaa-Ser system protein HxsD [gamma proteobacterium symbiont of Clathrolucina costata]